MHAGPMEKKKTKCNKKLLCPLIFPVPVGAQKQNMQHVQSGVRNMTRPAGGSSLNVPCVRGARQSCLSGFCSSSDRRSRKAHQWSRRVSWCFLPPRASCGFERKATNSAHVAVDRTGYGSPGRQMARLASKVVSICSLAADSRQATLSRLSLKSPRSECI